MKGPESVYGCLSYRGYPGSIADAAKQTRCTSSREEVDVDQEHRGQTREHNSGLDTHVKVSSSHVHCL